MTVDWIGWFATAVFVSSYFSNRPATLRRVQGVAALAWAVYGGLIHALPVLVANIIVMSAAVWTSFRQPRTAPAAGVADDAAG